MTDNRIFAASTQDAITVWWDKPEPPQGTYAVWLGGKEAALTNKTHATIAGLAPASVYDIEVRAGDKMLYRTTACTLSARRRVSVTDFGAVGDERNALLLIFVKDIAVWHFVNLCNAGTDLQLRQDRYERAVAWLKSVQRSDTKPNLPVVEDADGDGKPDPAVGEYIFGSNPKRSQHF